MNQINASNSNTIVSYKWNDPQEVPDSCGICLEVLKKEHSNSKTQIVYHQPLSSKARHCFHKGCLSQWIRTAGSGNKCPSCRIVFSNESIKQELAPSLMERVMEMRESLGRMGKSLLRRAARGAYYGAWSWAAVQMLIGSELELGTNMIDLRSAMITSAVTSAIALPLIVKSCSPNETFLSRCLCIFPLVVGALSWPLRSPKIGIAARCLDALASTPVALSRESFGIMYPEPSTTPLNLERLVDNLSLKLIPSLGLGFVLRRLFEWAGELQEDF